MLAPLADAIDLPFPPSIISDRKSRHRLRPSTSSRDMTPSNKQIEIKLERLVRDEGMFEHALASLNGLLQERPGLLIERPSTQEHLAERYYPITLELDTVFNFGLAVVGRVTQALIKLAPGMFVVHAGDGRADVTDLVYQCNRRDILNIEYKTCIFLGEDDWNSLEQEIDANTNFYWPGPDDCQYQNSKVTRVFVHIWAQLIRWKTETCVLTCGDRSMFCRRVAQALHCSKVYICASTSPSVARVLLATLLASADCDVSPSIARVRFGLPLHLGEATGNSKYFLTRQLISSRSSASVEPLNMTAMPVVVRFTSLDVHMVFPEKTTWEQLLHIWNSSHKDEDLQNLNQNELSKCAQLCITMSTGYHATSRPALLSRISTQLNTSPPTFSSSLIIKLGESNSDSFQSNHSTVASKLGLPPSQPFEWLPVNIDTHLGWGRGAITRGGIALANTPVIVKESEDADDAILLDEAGWFPILAPVLGDHIPILYGAFRDDVLKTTLLLMSHAGKALESWRDLSVEQSMELKNIVGHLNHAGYHHGDLLPRNVCVDAYGKIRLVDLGSVECCDCMSVDSDGCRELRELIKEIESDRA